MSVGFLCSCASITIVIALGVERKSVHKIWIDKGIAKLSQLLATPEALHSTPINHSLGGQSFELA